MKFLSPNNVSTIYHLLQKEVQIDYLPLLYCDYNNGYDDSYISLKEGDGHFKLKLTDSGKINYYLFSSIKNAVDYLVEFYKTHQYVDKPEEMRKIFYKTLNLE